MDQFVNIFLGFEHDCKKGVFGHVKHYYGVVEAQNRGSLHLHILIWLEGALSPLKIQEKATQDFEFKDRLFRWLESIFKHDLPHGTTPVVSTRNNQIYCLLGRPPHPDSPDFDFQWAQFLRKVLDASGHVHTHGETCYKHLPFSKSVIPDCDLNKLFEVTYMDADGRIHHKREHGMVVRYNLTISLSFQCNTDGKFVGSGALRMTISIYMTNYTAKATLDSATVMSALAAATKAMQNIESEISISDSQERGWKLLLKTLNQLNGRRELSAQQVASSLLAIPNHISDAGFAVFYWTRCLNWLSLTHFPCHKPKGLMQVQKEVKDSVCVESVLIDVFLLF
ncbi:hypothetical protein C8J56DRAFT_770012 [Mycena floridula]|nr:hypothetical protein C8J56DRAFT_770012 [Mycena floridula]